MRPSASSLYSAKEGKNRGDGKTEVNHDGDSNLQRRVPHRTPGKGKMGKIVKSAGGAEKGLSRKKGKGGGGLCELIVFSRKGWVWKGKDFGNKGVLKERGHRD